MHLLKTSSASTNTTAGTHRVYTLAHAYEKNLQNRRVLKHKGFRLELFLNEKNL